MKNLIKTIALLLGISVMAGCYEYEEIEPTSNSAVNPFEWPISKEADESMPSSPEGDTNLKDWWHLY